MPAAGLRELARRQRQGQKPAADAVLILDDGDVVALAQERERRRQPGHPGPQNQHVLGARTLRTDGRGQRDGTEGERPLQDGAA